MAERILLYTRGSESMPANLTLRDNLANALIKANQPESAIPLIWKCSPKPSVWRSDFNLGFAYYKTGTSPARKNICSGPSAFIRAIRTSTSTWRWLTCS